MKLTSGLDHALRAADAILDISADAVISTNERQVIIRFNHGAEEIFGYTAEEMIGQPIDLLIPSRFRPSHGDHVREFAESAVPARRMGERRTISGLRKGNIEFPAEASISKTSIDGSLIFTVVLRDVSERVRIERGQRFLAQAGELLANSLDVETTLRSVSELSVPTLGDWCVIFSGSPTRRAHAIHADPARLEHMQRLIEIPFTMRAEHPITELLNTGEPVLISQFGPTSLAAFVDSAEHRSILEALRPGSMMGVPMRARDRVLGAIAFFADSTRERPLGQNDLELALELGRRAALALDNAALYESAQAAVRARDDVLAVVSHDLGNPLAAIRLGTTLLLRRIPEVEKRSGAWQHLDNIRISVLQMERLIRDLLEVKRIEAGYFELEREPIKVGELLAEAVEQMRTITDSAGLVLAAYPPDHDIRIQADRERLMQVFSNLIGNAAKYSPRGAEISVSAVIKDSVVQFSVLDRGSGMAPEHLPYVFDRFWQARRTGGHGIGLGLAIVKGIVEAHGGRVWVQSVVGEGSTFSFSLPQLL